MPCLFCLKHDRLPSNGRCCFTLFSLNPAQDPVSESFFKSLAHPASGSTKLRRVKCLPFRARTPSNSLVKQPRHSARILVALINCIVQSLLISSFRIFNASKSFSGIAEAFGSVRDAKEAQNFLEKLR